MTLAIGLTGGIASGKSTVSNILAEMGLAIIDADQISREVVNVGEGAYQDIVTTFGTEILLADQSINRAKLGSIIFNDHKQREKLNQIVHPAVRKKMLKQKEHLFSQGKKTVILDIPLLFESKLTHLVDRSVLVYVDADVQKKRLMKRNNLSEQEALARISSQMPLIEKIPLADAILNNNGSVDELVIQVKRLTASWNLV